MSNNQMGPAQSLYMRLDRFRLPFLERARDAALFTIPSLYPPAGYSGSTKLYNPFQSIGARGVNNIASRLVLTQLPSTRRFFRLILTEMMEQLITKNGGDKSIWEEALGKVELQVERRIEALGARLHAFSVFRYLVVGGNVCVFTNKLGTKVYTLDQYVVRRDPNGDVLDLVVCEGISEDMIPDSVRPLLGEDSEKDEGAKDTDCEKDYELYTHVYRDGKRMKSYQEICGHRVPGSEGSYKLDACPWMALRWVARSGEDYSRSLCDDYMGDLLACESLSRSIIRSAAVAAKTVFLCNPNGQTSPEDLRDAEEGGFVAGMEGDVTALGVEKTSDFQVARGVLEEINTRLSYAFLLNSAVRRQGERVTAEEIRFMASELEDALGGTYSTLSSEYQLPLVRIVMDIMTRDGSLPALPDKSIRPTIITGIDALGRAHELARLDAFLGGALQTFGPEVLRFINMPEYLRRRATGLDTDPKGLVKEQQQVDAETQAARAAEMQQHVAPAVVKAVSDNRIAASQADAQTQ